MDDQDDILLRELKRDLQDTLETDRDERQSLEILANDLRADSGSDSSSYQVECRMLLLLLPLLLFPFVY